jgi:hypothetical protein
VWIYSDRIVIISLAREAQALKERIYVNASLVQSLRFEIIDGAKPYYEKITLQAGLSNADDVKNFFEPEPLTTNHEQTARRQPEQKLCI